MKATFHREGFFSAFQLACVAVAAKDVKPILRNIKMIVDDKRCVLMATDLELGIVLEVRGVKVEEPGEAILPTARMVPILRESTDDELHLEADIDRCQIQGKTTEFEMASEDPANFPDLPLFSDDKYHVLSAGTLREMIKRTIFAAATENPRYAVTGILWELDGKQARLVATDGRRLAMIESVSSSQGDHNTNGQTPVVPTKAMALLEKILQDPKENVQVSFRANDVLFKTSRAIIYSRLVEGRYPAYREVFPKKSLVKIPFIAGPMRTAVRQSAIMTDAESKRVMFHFAKKKLTLQARGAETGRSKVEMDLDYDGKDIDINFDPNYLTDMLRVLDESASMTIEISDGDTAALFRCGDDYSYVVMPLS